MTTLAKPSKPKSRHFAYNLRFKPHPGQLEVHNSPARFKVVACGRQWGKTRYASVWTLQRAVAGKRGWWVAPDAIVADIGWETIRMLSAQVPGAVIQDSYPRTVTFPSGGWIQVKGAHLPGKLRGRTLDFLVIDEAAFIPSAERWNSELRPTLAIKGGEALFVSTFKGENWFYDLYELGQNPNYPDWESWRKPSIENPYFPLEELELARRTTPPGEFQQEYEANPLVYVGAVFPGEKVQEAVERGSSGACEWRDDLPTFAGLDWGYTNATAFEVCQESAEGDINWLHESLWVATDLDIRIAAMVEVCRLRSVQMVYADASAPGENAKLQAQLRRAGLKTRVLKIPFAKYKDSAIVARRWYLEQGLESMSPSVPELIRTTKRYHYKEGTEDVAKEDDHPVDAATAFYASRRAALVSG